MSASLTDTSVFMLERKRTSRGATGAMTSRVAHQILVCWPGTSVASMVVTPLAEERLVIRSRRELYVGVIAEDFERESDAAC